MATSKQTITAVTGSGPYTVTIADASVVAANDHLGAPTLTGDGVYLITGKAGNDLTVTDTLDPDAGTYGAPVIGPGFTGTPTAENTTPIPYGAQNWNAAATRNARQAITTTADPGVADVRLSLHATDAMGEGTAAGTIYLHRFEGRNLAIYNGVNWELVTVPATPASVAFSGLSASTVYDVFGYSSGGTVALETIAWSTTVTRATALALQDGVWCKSTQLTRRYLGSFYLDGSKQATDANAAARLDVWNLHNRVMRCAEIEVVGGAWSHAVNGSRRPNGSASYDVQVLRGLDLDAVQAQWTVRIQTPAGPSSSQESAGLGADGSGWNGYAYVSTPSKDVTVTAVGAELVGQGLRAIHGWETHYGTGTNTMNTGLGSYLRVQALQ